MTTPITAAKARALGPGTLSFGTGASAQDFTAQVTTCKISTDSDSDDDIPTLSGDTVAGETTNTFALEANFLQDFDKTGCIAWSWANSNQQVAFLFIPNKAYALQVQGFVTVRPMEIGGDVKKKNTSEIEWPVVGTPTLAFPTT